MCEAGHLSPIDNPSVQMFRTVYVHKQTVLISKSVWFSVFDFWILYSLNCNNNLFICFLFYEEWMFFHRNDGKMLLHRLSHQLLLVFLTLIARSSGCLSSDWHVDLLAKPFDCFISPPLFVIWNSTSIYLCFLYLIQLVHYLSFSHTSAHVFHLMRPIFDCPQEQTNCFTSF